MRGTSSAFLQYLLKLEIGIGTDIRLIEKIPVDHSLVISIGGKGQTPVSQKFGESILPGD